MTIIIDDNENLFQPHVYENEAEFERSVISLADQIFGPSTIYIDVKKRVAGPKTSILRQHLLKTGRRSAMLI